MSGSAEGLEEHCRQVTSSAASAIQWLQAIRARVSTPTDTAEQELRRIGFRAERLRQAATRPINVGVFGGGQSGKSYLSAALARRGAAPLRVVIGEERVDYFTRINPVRSPKSSACVTRFSLRPPAAAVPSAPVSLRLLSQSDVIRIITNSYLEDVDPAATAPATAERLGAIVSRLRGQLGGAQAGLTADDVGEIRSYLHQYFHDHRVIAALGPDFWAAAAELAGQLGIQGRALLFSVLWGETPQLTVMCVRLLQALESLGNAELAFCGLEALDPQAMSILDAETMMQGLEDEAMPAVLVSTLDGRQVELTRPVVAALAAELHLTLEEQPFGFFNSADLLDFPGAPPRSRFTEPESLYADPTNRARHFRRGKAAFLFQRYVANQELTALVLCMEDAPPVARTLPEMVREWIDAAQGPTPEERRDMPCALFVALTKFDQELKEELRQKEDDPEHWARRLKGVFEDFLCRNYRWSDRWAPGRAFNNVFWLRNPAIAEPEVLQYNASGRETGLVDRGRIARMRGRFIAAPAARQHFTDPTRAWDEALKLNDGGVSYLAGQLRPVCDPELRRRQIAELLAGLARDMHQCLEPFYVAASPTRAAQQAAAEAPSAEAPAANGGAAESGTADASAGASSGVDIETTDTPETAYTDPAPASADAMADQRQPTAAASPDQPAPAASVSVSPMRAVAEAMAAMPAPANEGGSRSKLLLAAGVIGVLALGAGGYFLLSGPASPPPSASLPAPPAGPVSAGPVSIGQTTAQTAPPAATPAPQPSTRCGPVVAAERLASLPTNLALTPLDLVCVSKAWISVGRAGDAVMQLTRALQDSPRRVFGPASLELGKLYDPLRPNPNWPPNAVYAAEKYQDAIADGNFPDIQREAQTNLDALRNAPSR